MVVSATAPADRNDSVAGHTFGDRVGANTPLYKTSDYRREFRGGGLSSILDEQSHTPRVFGVNQEFHELLDYMVRYL